MSVGPSVGRSVGPSVGLSSKVFENFVSWIIELVMSVCLQKFLKILCRSVGQLVGLQMFLKILFRGY